MKFKIEKKKQFLKGRTMTYIGKELNITPQYLCLIFNGKRKCSKRTAITLSMYVGEEYGLFFEEV